MYRDIHYHIVDNNKKLETAQMSLQRSWKFLPQPLLSPTNLGGEVGGGKYEEQSLTSMASSGPPSPAPLLLPTGMCRGWI